MYKLATAGLLGALALAGVSAAFAADLPEPPPYEPPVVVSQEIGGWYIRGDIDYHKSKIRGTEYITYGCDGGACGAPTDPGTSEFSSTKLDEAWSAGGGVGYQVNHYLRSDLTLDYWAKAKFNGTSNGIDCGTGLPCSSTDESDMSALVLLANAYIDLGTWHRVTPYIGAGIGGAYVQWDDLANTITGVTTDHAGAKNWRFAWALSAGASYCLTSKLDLDLGYRFTRVSGGRMLSQYAPDGGFLGVGPGYDKGLDNHEIRAGLRYNFGSNGKAACGPQDVAYEPEPPVYK